MATTIDAVAIVAVGDVAIVAATTVAIGAAAMDDMINELIYAEIIIIMIIHSISPKIIISQNVRIFLTY